MKTILRFPVLMIILSVFFLSCQKETSFENGNNSLSVGSLQVDGLGSCVGAVVSGSYKKDTLLNATNFASIQVKVDTVGSYNIKTDTVNGYSFHASGVFSATGVMTIKLIAEGKPLATGTNIFTVTYNGSVCEFSVTVTAGTGGSSVFTINCVSAVINGTYISGIALTAANTVVLTVNITTPGTWSISTNPVNGIIFSGTGTFSVTGSNTITLTGSGTPAASGTFNIPVTYGASSCSFPVICIPPPDYFPRTIYSNWSYQRNSVAADSLLIKVIPQTLSAAGNTFNIFMETNDASLGFDSSGYYRKSGHDYYLWENVQYIGFDQTIWVEYIFLKDNLSAGNTWTSPGFTGTITPAGGSPVSYTLRFIFTILQQNTSVTVTGINYPNTIVVKAELQQFVTGSWQTLSAGSIQGYYAANKGLIKQDFYDPTGTPPNPDQLDVRRLVVY